MNFLGNKFFLWLWKLQKLGQSIHRKAISQSKNVLLHVFISMHGSCQEDATTVKDSSLLTLSNSSPVEFDAWETNNLAILENKSVTILNTTLKY